MKRSQIIRLPLPAALALLLTSCGSFNFPLGSQPTSATKKPPVITDYRSFTAQPGYPATLESYRNEEIFARIDPSNSRILISLSHQRAFLLQGDDVALDYPVSTGKTTHPTPAGDYSILEMIVDKRSNLYGQVLDANGAVVDSSADSREAKVPPGGQFLGAAMPYWMRLTWTGIGMHVGKVPRYPASHACIRGQANVVPLIFSKVRIGTPVTIVDSL